MLSGPTPGQAGSASCSGLGSQKGPLAFLAHKSSPWSIHWDLKSWPEVLACYSLLSLEGQGYLCLSEPCGVRLSTQGPGQISSWARARSLGLAGWREHCLDGMIAILYSCPALSLSPRLHACRPLHPSPLGASVPLAQSQSCNNNTVLPSEGKTPQRGNKTMSRVSFAAKLGQMHDNDLLP